MDEVTEQAAAELASVLVPPSMTEIQRELQGAIDVFRRAARTDLQGREADDAGFLEQAGALAEQGAAGVERVAAMLRRITG